MRIDGLWCSDPTTAGGYSISEWWLDPRTTGPGAHVNPEDDAFYVLDGTISVLVGDRWVDASKGAFVAVPGVSPTISRTAAMCGPAS